MQLTDEHINTIEKRLQAEGIKDERLREDLLDHVCSYIEYNEEEADFNLLLQQAISILAPGGMHQIEEEKFFLFHFNKQITMKRVLFFSGFITTFVFTTGLTFKLMHWPGASILLLLGYIGMLISILFIAVNAFNNATSHSASYKLRIIAGIVAGLLVATGSIFKLMHWPSANIQFVLGILLLNFIFLPMFFYHLYRQSLSKTGNY